MKVIILLVWFFAFLIFLGYFFVGKPPSQEEILWGVNFSQKHASLLGLDWKEVFLALIKDLGVKRLKISTHWDLIQPERKEYRFEDLDWQIKTAKKYGVKVILVIGMKTPRWPECHIPSWARTLSKKDQQYYILKLLRKIVLRYKKYDNIWAWQIENEPFFPFGECPWRDKEFLKKEIQLVKSLDKKRPIVISDSGEGSFWVKAARLGDIVGITIYRKVWVKELKIYFKYPFPPVFYYKKANLIKKIFKKNVICIELQAEPWGPTLLYDLSLKEQEKTMNLEQFRKNIEFAKNTGLKEFYLWGGEWWYWLKKVHGKDGIWNEAMKLFKD